VLKVIPLSDTQYPSSPLEPTNRISSPQTVEAVSSNVTETRDGTWHGADVVVGNPFIGGQVVIVARLYVPDALVGSQ
jgi:hypothetical protein